MKNKGFTLVEIITVIALLALIGLIAVPIIDGVIKRSKDKIYDRQVNEIINSSKKYVTENSELVSFDNKTTVCLSTLKDLGYLDSEQIVDPRDDSIMNGGIEIEYSEEKKNFIYDYHDHVSSCE